MSANLENELRRTLADPPVALPEVADPVPELGRRVTRARHRRSAAAVLSVAAVLAAGVSGATALTHRPAHPGPDAAAAAAGGPQARVSAGPDIAPPPEVVEAARSALTGVVSGTPAGPVRWVAVSAGEYIVQIRLTGTATCKYCHDPAAGPDPVRGAFIEIRVHAQVTADAAGHAPGASTRVPAAADPGGYTLQQHATDLSRFGTVHQFPFPTR